METMDIHKTESLSVGTHTSSEGGAELERGQVKEVQSSRGARQRKLQYRKNLSHDGFHLGMRDSCSKAESWTP